MLRATATRCTRATSRGRGGTPPLAGSVINVQGVARPGNVVHVRTAKGRTVGAARPDSGGVNVVTVPARSAIVLDTAVAGPGALALITGSALRAVQVLPDDV